MKLIILITVVTIAMIVARCQVIYNQLPGAIVKVTFKSTIGIKFDSIPEKIRSRAKQILKDKNEQYWNDLAIKQIELTNNRFVFRPMKYEEEIHNRSTISLTPKEQWSITFLNNMYARSIDGHLLYVRDYEFETYILTDTESVVKSDSRLTNAGQFFSMSFVLPVDPTLIVQRTGYCCMDESQYPPNSVDAEDVKIYFNDTCQKEKQQSKRIFGCQQCHCSLPLPNRSCHECIKQDIGGVNVTIKFQRIKFNTTLANEIRYPKKLEERNGKVPYSNLVAYKPDFMEQTRLVYYYIAPGACELAEGCVGGTGWRRLLRFSATLQNMGIQGVIMGRLNYFLGGPPSELVTKYHLFEYSPCHKHYHFYHYGKYTYGRKQQSMKKRGFCLASVYRVANAEWSPLGQDHYTCLNQGISAGWGDTYNDALVCQWIDVSNYDTSVKPITDTLTTDDNPDSFLCEGKPVLAKTGDQIWIKTNFTTTCCSSQKTEGQCCSYDKENGANGTECCNGLPVYKRKCQYFDNYRQDNILKKEFTLGLDGNGQITDSCQYRSGSWSELRDCGFRLKRKWNYLSCVSPGDQVTLNVSLSSEALRKQQQYQIFRVCESSVQYKAGVACFYNNSLANVIVTDEWKLVKFQCPTKRADSQIEIGGHYSIYVAPYFEEDEHNATFIQWNEI